MSRFIEVNNADSNMPVVINTNFIVSLSESEYGYTTVEFTTGEMKVLQSIKELFALMKTNYYSQAS